MEKISKLSRKKDLIKIYQSLYFPDPETGVDAKIEGQNRECMNKGKRLNALKIFRALSRRKLHFLGSRDEVFEIGLSILSYLAHK